MQEKQTLILTLKLDPESQSFFDQRRIRYFPPERNLLAAHLTLFHQLPDEPATREFLVDLHEKAFSAGVTGLMNLGAGVAYRVSGSGLQALHSRLRGYFSGALIPQDLQSFRPHITVMNKSTPEKARAVLAELNATFRPFEVRAVGLDLWAYLGGPWQHRETIRFN